MSELPASNEKSNLHSHLVTVIKQRIIKWEYPPGFRLLEQDICDEYEVSRSPAREAFRTLEADGYLVKSPRKGYTVKQPDPGTAREMYEVRLALELFVIEHLASTAANDERLAALRETWGEINACVHKNNEEFAELDRKFHETFAETLGNATLTEHLRFIDERLHVFRTIEFLDAATRKETCIQHLDILTCVASGDVAAARAAVKRNIETAIQHVEEVIKEALAQSYMRQNGKDTWN